MAILSAVLFAYRWWALGGIGGYGTRLSISHSLNALFFRQWALLFFPLNWAAAGPLARAAACAIAVVLLVSAWIAKPSRGMLAGSVAFVIACALPVQHLLSIGSALPNSRFLYMGAVGWALLSAVVVDGMPAKPRILMPCLLLLIEFPLLENNLAIWRENADLARSACASFGRMVASERFAVVRRLPSTRKGAVFLANGFPQCVAMHSGVPAERILVRDAEPDAHYSGVREFIWNESRERFEQSR